MQVNSLKNDGIAPDLTAGEANRFSQSILDSFAVNIAVLKQDGTIVAVNKAWTSFAAENRGWEVRSTEIGVNYLDVAGASIGPYGSQGQAACASIKAVLEGSLPEFSLEYSSHTRGGQRWFLLQVIALVVSKNEAALVSHLDITSRKLAEIKREETAEQFREIANHLLQVFWIRDTVETRALYISPAFESIWGRTCQSVYDNHASLIDAIHPADRERMSAIMRDENKTGWYDEEYRIIRPDGSMRWIWARDYAVRDGENRIKRFVGIAEDITERKQLKAQFIESQKMEVVGQLAAGVAHDFNNVLGVIMGYSEMIVDELGLDHPVQKHTEEIRHAATRAAELTQQLLIFSRKQTVRTVVLDLNEVIAGMDKMLRRLIDENIDLTIVYGKQIGHIQADSGYLWQMLMNMVVNARDAMENGGKLTIATDKVTLDQAYVEAHPGTTPSDYVLLSVSDTGSGMTEEVKAHLFEAFFTTKPPGKGTGLGLATCQTIVQQAGGHIDVSSEVGRGTTFNIYFPMVDQPLPHAMPSLPRVKAHSKGTETILIVEDDQSVRQLARDGLQVQGYKVLTAINGQDALRVVGQFQGQPIALVITDVVMPHMGGKVMAEWLKTSYPDIKILFTSGYTDDAIVHHGELNPGIAFIAKPYTPVSLARKVREILDS